MLVALFPQLTGTILVCHFKFQNTHLQIIDGQPRGLLVSWDPECQGFTHSWLMLELIREDEGGLPARCYLDMSPRQFGVDKDFTVWYDPAPTQPGDPRAAPSPPGVIGHALAAGGLTYHLKKLAPIADHAPVKTWVRARSSLGMLLVDQLCMDSEEFFLKVLERLGLGSSVRKALNRRFDGSQWAVTDAALLEGFVDPPDQWYD